MRYFIPDGEEAERIRARPRAGGARGQYTDTSTGEHWRDYMNAMVPVGPSWSGLIREPVPDADVLLRICSDSADLDEVAGAAFYLEGPVDTRARLLDLIDALVKQSADVSRIRILLEFGAFEQPSGHCVSVGMMVEEIGRQFELSKRCAERSIAIRARVSGRKA